MEPWLLGFEVLVDRSLPPNVVRVEAAETHLVKLHPNGVAEFVGGPLDGTTLAERRTAE